MLNINTNVFLRNKKKSINQYTDLTCNLKKTILPLSSN